MTDPELKEVYLKPWTPQWPHKKYIIFHEDKDYWYFSKISWLQFSGGAGTISPPYFEVLSKDHAARQYTRPGFEKVFVKVPETVWPLLAEAKLTQ